MIILAIDLTSEHGSFAILKNDEILAERNIRSKEGFAHLLFSAIENALADAGLELNQIDCFASASGPGAFTGVRIGLAAVKGLAEATDRPALGVSNLRALSSFGRTTARAVVVDARRGDVFSAVYDDRSKPTSPETVGSLDVWLQTLTAPSYDFISQDRRWLSEMLSRTQFSSATVLSAPLSLAAAIGRCAYVDLKAGVEGDPVLLDANYIRRSDAELFWRDR